MQLTCRRSSILTCLLAGLPMFGADVSPNARQIFDKQLGASEREVMAVVETMPANRFDFVPKSGAFTSVRTFGVQARHIAFCLNEVATALLGEPMLPHTDQEGPRNLTSKEDIVRYLKDAFAHAHKAIGTLTNEPAGTDTRSLRREAQNYATRCSDDFPLAYLGSLWANRGVPANEQFGAPRTSVMHAKPT